ncbi:hypothetical protein MHBO_005059 [Bonamia ostreae]|uniref:Uncharacterized protein n=1 Tax=Bonamia ostreae TaxID=126728 RepID=A0ABV2AUZ8_9EUKA
MCSRFRNSFYLLTWRRNVGNAYGSSKLRELSNSFGFYGTNRGFKNYAYYRSRSGSV